MGGSPSLPPVPPVPPPPAVPDYEGQRQAEARSKLEAKLRKKMGSKQTILTSSLGDTSEVPSEKKTLLGE